VSCANGVKEGEVDGKNVVGGFVGKNVVKELKVGGTDGVEEVGVGGKNVVKELEVVGTNDASEVKRFTGGSDASVSEPWLGAVAGGANKESGNDENCAVAVPCELDGRRRRSE